MSRPQLNTLIIASSLSLFWASGTPAAQSASSQLKPVLQAIDPSQAKLDTSNQPAHPPSPNPSNKVKGKPITQGKRGQSAGTAQPSSGSQAQSAGYPAQGSDSQQQDNSYPPQDAGNPPPDGGYQQGAGYAPPGDGYQQQGGGYSQQGGGYQPQSGGYPPQGGGKSPQGRGYPSQGAGYQQQGSGYQPQAGGYQGGNTSPTFPSENLIPDFGQPLPKFPAATSSPAGGQPKYGQGFPTYRAPDSTTAATPLTGSQPSYMPAAQGGSAASAAVEARIVRLEQTAFGSTYPEHELDDRVDHLESEVFGNTGSGDITSRLAKLEAKLGGQGAFGRTAQAPVSSPVVAASAGSNTYPQSRPAHPSGQGYSPPAGSGLSYNYGASPSYPSANSGNPPGSPPAPASPAAINTGQRQVAVTRPQDVVPGYGATASSTTGNFNFQSVVNSIPFDARAGDYFTQVRRGPGGALARWTRFPVRVHLPQGSPQSWEYSLESGVKKWGQYLPITVSSPNEAADIEVVWINHLPPNALGITRVQVQRGTMQCVIYLLRPTYYLPDVPERALSGVFLHEMGHGLGIFGHSDFKDDLMVPIELSMVGRKRGDRQFQFGNITHRDINTLKHIYETPSLPADYSSPQPTDWTLKSRN